VPTAIAWLGLVKYARTLQVFYFTLKLLGYTAYLYWGEISMDYSIISEYLPIKDINFMSAKGKKRKLDEAIYQDADDEVTVQQITARGRVSTESEMDTLFAKLNIGAILIVHLSGSILSVFSRPLYLRVSGIALFARSCSNLQEAWIEIAVHYLLNFVIVHDQCTYIAVNSLNQ